MDLASTWINRGMRFRKLLYILFFTSLFYKAKKSPAIAGLFISINISDG
jgi:hypothetical protein